MASRVQSPNWKGFFVEAFVDSFLQLPMLHSFGHASNGSRVANAECLFQNRKVFFRMLGQFALN
jgi:hypothetical protein